MGLQQWRIRHFSGKMVVEIGDTVVRFKQELERVEVAVHGDVKDGDTAVSELLEPGEQPDVTLDPGYNLVLGLREFESELMKGEDPVRVAVEYIYLH